MSVVHNSPGSHLRTLLLAGTIFLLTATTFTQDNPIAAAAYYPRYGFALLLLLVTWNQGARTAQPFKTAPPTARTLLRGAWLLVGVAVASALWSVDPGETLLQAGVFTLLVTTMRVHITHRWHHPGTVATDLRVIFWTLALVVVVSLGTLRLRGGRLAGLFDNPNTLGLVAAMATALGIGLLAQRRTLPTGLATALCVVALLLTQSRTALVAVILAVVIVTARRRISLALATVACFAGAAVVGTLLVLGHLPLPRVFDRFAGDQPDGLFNQRGDAWAFAWRLWEQRPVTGYGFRTGEIVFTQHSAVAGFLYDTAHSSYLQLLLEVGMLGVVPFVVMLVALARIVATTRPDGLGTGLVALVVVGLAMAVTESALFGVGQVMSWTFWLGAAAASMAPRREREPVQRPGRARQLTRR